MGSNLVTEPKVFIIESLDFDDEKKNLFEGQVVSSILSLNKIESQYYYIRTKQEFKEVLGIFYDSCFRYLHISCHGGANRQSICTTLDDIPFIELGKLLEPCLYRKRLFLSACSVVNKHLATQVIPKTDCFSIIGPRNDVTFSDATIMWASFYHLMFKKNAKSMDREGIMTNLQLVANTFGEEFSYFSKSGSSFRKTSIRPQIYRN